MQDTYPGTKRTTEKVVEHLIQTGGFQIIGQNEQVHPASVLSQFSVVFVFVTTSLAKPRCRLTQIPPNPYWKILFPVGAVTRLNGLLSEMPQLQVTRDCVRLADRILHMIEEEQEKQQEKALQQKV
jgi:cobaltochelatase CobT